ncbi:MAG: response regulator [Bacteroidota bacterium]|nr:response regulator [Bacteroidota bacterium]
MTLPIKILLVDDDEVSNYINSELIENIGISSQVKVCENGREAIDYLTSLETNENQQIPQLILLDLNMPEMNGFGFLEAYQDLPDNVSADVIIILLTTSISEEDKEKIKKVHNSEIVFLEKPLTISDLERIKNQYFIS